MDKSTNSTACGSALVMVLVLLQIIESGGILVKYNVTLTVENEMLNGQKLDLHCWLNGDDLGQLSVMQFNRWEWKFHTRYLQNDLFACTFATAGKPNTTIDVYKGYFFNNFEHRPCECLETGYCFWQALNEGLWCNSKFIQNW